MCLISTPRPKAWGTITHNAIIKKGLRIVTINIDVPELTDFYTGDTINMSKLCIGAVDPDWEEKNPGSHYYVAPTKCHENKGQYYKTTFLHKLGSASARTRLEDHYQQAINLYKKGDYAQASLHLGRACHYLQDICCPPHASGIQYPIVGRNYHVEYENYCDKLSCTPEYQKDDEIVLILSPNRKERWFKYLTDTWMCYWDREVCVLSSNWGKQINDFAILAGKEKKSVLSGDQEEWKRSFHLSFRASQMNTVKLLIKFYVDTQAVGLTTLFYKYDY